MEQIKKAFSFNGKATRSEYWGVMLSIIGGVVVAMLMVMPAMETGDPSALVAIIFLAAIIAAVWAQTATVVRRLRDCGLSVWWVLATFIPNINIIPMVVFGCLQPKKGE